METLRWKQQIVKSAMSKKLERERETRPRTVSESSNCLRVTKFNYFEIHNLNMISTFQLITYCT